MQCCFMACAPIDAHALIRYGKFGLFRAMSGANLLGKDTVDAPICLVRICKRLWLALQTVGYERLSGAQRLAVLDALIHAAADSEGFRAHVLGTARQQVAMSCGYILRNVFTVDVLLSATPAIIGKRMHALSAIEPRKRRGPDVAHYRQAC